MPIEVGDNVHIITRRQFETDLRRHFVGRVEEVAGDLVRVRGHAFVFDDSANEFTRREEEGVRIFAFSDAALIISIISSETDLAALRYEIDERGRRVITDGKSMIMNVSEFGANR